MNSHKADKAVHLVPDLGDYLKDDPFLKYNLGNGNVIRILESTNVDGYFIRSRQSQYVDASKTADCSTNPTELSSFEQNSGPQNLKGPQGDENITRRQNNTRISQNSTGSADSNISLNLKRWASIFIPKPISDYLVLFKTITKCSSNEVLDEICSQLVDQLNNLSEEICSQDSDDDASCSKVMRLKVHVVFLIPKMLQSLSTTVVEKLKKIYEEESTSKIFLEATVILTNKDASKIHEEAKTTIERAKLTHVLQDCNSTNYYKSIIEKMIYDQEFDQPFLHFKDITVVLQGSQVKRLSDKHDGKAVVLETFESYFPTRGNALITLPSLDKCLSNILYSTNEKGERVGNESHVGEYWKFPEEVLRKLDKPVGVLMSSYKADHIKNILHLPEHFDLQFQFDWLLCGSQFIVAFEVSVSTKCGNIATPLENKLRQVIEKIVPKMKMILYTIYKNKLSLAEDRTDSNLGFKHFLKTHFQAVVYIPESCLEVIQKALHSKVAKSTNLNRNQCLDDLIEKAEKSESLKLIKILTHERADMSQLQIYNIDCHLNLTKSEISIEQLFGLNCSNSGSLFEVEQTEMVNYISSVLCLSFLMIGNPLMSKVLDIDTRYEKAPKETAAEKSRFEISRQILPADSEENIPKLILSPQQCQILGEDKYEDGKYLDQFYCFLGEPGSGKSSVLLAKALIEAHKEETKYVFFVIPESRQDFSRVVHKFFDDNLKMTELRDKVKLLLVDEFGFGSLIEQIEKHCGISWRSELSKSVMLIDEIYMRQGRQDSPYFINQYTLCNVILHCKQCWIVFISVGFHQRFGSPLSRICIRHFEMKGLNVLFRSSHHISTFTNRFIHSSKPITNASASVTGCYASSQLQIDYSFFVKDDVMQSKISDWIKLREDFAKERMMVVFTEDKDEERWRRLLEVIQVNHSELEPVATKHYVINPFKENDRLPFAGCEAKSIVLILDIDCKAVQVMISIIIAISRAQYEVMIKVNEEFQSSFKEFMETKPTRYLQRFAKLPAIADKVFTCDDFTPLTDDHSMRLFIGSVVISEKLHVLKSFVKNFPPALNSKLALFIFKSFMLVRREDLGDFREDLKKYMGDDIENSIVSALNENNFTELEEVEQKCLAYGTIKNFAWLLELIGLERSRQWARRSNKWLLLACMNLRSNIIKEVVNLLQKLDSNLLITQIGAIYTDDFGYQISEKGEFQPATLLLILCSQNATSDYLESILSNGFPKQLIEFSLDGRNAHQWCQMYNNRENLKILMSYNEWKI